MTKADEFKFFLTYGRMPADEAELDRFVRHCEEIRAQVEKLIEREVSPLGK